MDTTRGIGARLTGAAAGAMFLALASCGGGGGGTGGVVTPYLDVSGDYSATSTVAMDTCYLFYPTPAQQTVHLEQKSVDVTLTSATDTGECRDFRYRLTGDSMFSNGTYYLYLGGTCRMYGTVRSTFEFSGDRAHGTETWHFAYDAGYCWGVMACDEQFDVTLEKCDDACWEGCTEPAAR